MPRSSDRQKLLSHLRKKVLLALYERAWTRHKTPARARAQRRVRDAVDVYRLACRSRYLKARRGITVPKTDALRNHIWNLPPVEFRHQLRMDKTTFEKILHLIKDDPVFHSRSNRKQASVREQAALAFYRLGKNGTGASYLDVAIAKGFGKGTVPLYTKRVITALLNLRDRFLRFPDATERMRIASRIESRFGLKGCVGSVDGTFAVFAEKPRIDGETYWTRKKNYAMNVQIVFDDRRRIRYIYTGWPGSVHDSRVWEHSTIFRRPGMFFSDGQWLASDTAYKLTKWCQKPFPEPECFEPRNKPWNKSLSGARVGSEHGNGMLKNRWASLKRLPHQIQKGSEIKDVCDWIHACAVLHNLALHFNDNWSDRRRDDEVDEADNADGGGMVGGVVYEPGTDGKAFRRMLQAHLNEWLERRAERRRR